MALSLFEPIIGCSAGQMNKITHIVFTQLMISIQTRPGQGITVTQPELSKENIDLVPDCSLLLVVPLFDDWECCVDDKTTS